VLGSELVFDRTCSMLVGIEVIQAFRFANVEAKLLGSECRLKVMSADINQLCDPASYSLEEALRLAGNFAATTPGFGLLVVQSLQAQCHSAHTDFPRVFRGLDILGGLLGGENGDANRLATLIRPFFKSSDPQIASKAVLILGRQSRNVAWLRNVMNETDERIRANLIEALWHREEPEIEVVFHSALMDSHPRVAANAAYGLYLIENPGWPEALDALIAHTDARYRRSAIWVVKKMAAADGPLKLQRLIRDTDPDVRRAAFDALKHIRDKAILRAA
jgi:hypothetical protein